MKALYSLLTLIGFILFFAFGLPWIFDFVSTHYIVFSWIAVIVAFIILWAMIHAAWFAEED